MSERVPCKKCGAMILPTTAKRTNGLCMPCFQKEVRLHPYIEKLKKKRNYKKFSKLLSSSTVKHRFLRSDAIDALLDLGTEESIDCLYNCLKDEYNDSKALKAICEIGGNHAIETLKLGISECIFMGPILYEEAFDALGKLCGKECTDFLKTQIESHEYSSHAWKTLCKINIHEAVEFWCKNVKKDIIDFDGALRLCESLCVLRSLRSSDISQNDFLKVCTTLRDIGINPRYKQIRHEISDYLQTYKRYAAGYGGYDITDFPYLDEIERLAARYPTRDELLIARVNEILERVKSEYGKQPKIEYKPVTAVVLRCYYKTEKEKADLRYAQMIAYAEKHKKGAPIWIHRAKSKSNVEYPHWIAIPFKETNNWMINCQKEFDRLHWSAYGGDHAIPSFTSYTWEAKILHIWTKKLKI